MRVALYARVSTEEQALHGLSIDAQLAALREAFPNGKEYVDLGISARKPISKRPELQRLLRDVEQDRIDLICFCKLDRWTRNIREYYKAQDILEAHNVAWKALHEDYETQTAAGRLKVNIMLAVAQDEADRTSERIKAVLERKRQMGLVPGGKTPIGVKIVDGHYAPSEDAELVGNIYRDYIASRSVLSVARECGYSGNGLRRLLQNPIYKTLNIVDDATWNKAQEILKERSQRHSRSDRVYLFSGLLFCPYCGRKLCACFVKETKYYRCMRHYDGKCPGIHVREDAVEKYLLAQIIPEIEGENMRIKRKQKKPVNVSALKQKRDKLTDLYMNDLIDKDKYTNDYKELTAKIEEAENQPKPVDVEIVKKAVDIYPMLSNPAQKAFWSSLVTKIVPTDDGFTVNYT